MDSIVNINLYRMLLCRYSELKNETISSLNENDPFNLYMIFRGSKIVLNENNCKINNNSGEVDIEYIIRARESVKSKKISLKIDPNFLPAKFITKYPYDFFTINYKDEIVTGGNISGYLRLIRGRINQGKHPLEVSGEDGYEFLDIDLLYVGQAQCRINNSNAVKRLLNHSTYQEILATEVETDPNCEIYVGLIQFQILPFFLFYPKTGVNSENQNSASSKLLVELMNTESFRREAINIAEAALIKFFEPSYNIDFKDNFPSPHHTSYDFFYAKGIHSIMVEFFPLYHFNARVSTKRRINCSKEFITFQLDGKSSQIGILKIPSHNE